MLTLCIWDLQRFETFRNCILFAHFGFYEISTVVMRIMLTMANIVLIIISNIAHTVYIRFKAFWNFWKLQFVLHILAFTKFLLRWWAPWKLWWNLFKSSFPTMPTLCIWDLQCFKTFRNCSLFCTFGFYEMVMRIMPTMANTVLIIICNIAHTVYIRLKAFWNFSKLQFVLHIFAFTKFLLLWCTSC